LRNRALPEARAETPRGQTPREPLEFQHKLQMEVRSLQEPEQETA